MGRFAKVWPDDLKEAIVHAHLDKGATVRAAVELAVSGRLPSAERPSENVTVPKLKGKTAAEIKRRLENAAYTWTSAAKRERSGVTVPDWIAEDGAEKAIDQLAGRLVAIAAGEIRRVEKTRVGERDLDRARKAAQVLREARALSRGDSPTRSGKARDANAGKAIEDNGSAEAGAHKLLAASRADNAGETPRQDDSEQSNDNGDSNAAGGANEAERQSEAAGAAQSGGILEDEGEERADPRASMAAKLGIAKPDTERDTE